MIHAVNVLCVTACVLHVLDVCRTYYHVLLIFTHVALHFACCINFHLLYYEG